MTAKAAILNFFRTELALGHEWKWGGQIEDHVRDQIGTKASVVSVCLRIMQREGYIEKRRQQVDGQGPGFVQYRYLTDAPAKKGKEPRAKGYPLPKDFDVVARINAMPTRDPEPQKTTHDINALPLFK